MYSFMLVIPKSVISEKILEVHQDVGKDIIDVFIIPFALFSLTMMVLISYFLFKISKRITQPIIELFQKIQDMIKAHQKEKEQLIKEQTELTIGGEKKQLQTDKKKEFNIMLNY
jgi:hypothetical protein